MRTDLVLDALRMAPGTRSPGADVQLVAHTDRGSSTRRSPTPRNSTTTRSSAASDRSATPTTIAWPSFIASFKTELIADRAWRTSNQLELAIVEYIAWFNHDRLHESFGDIPPIEAEALHAPPGREVPNNILEEETAQIGLR